MIMVLTPTDFPEPVVPATRRWGISARSATTGLPVTSTPSAIGRSAWNDLNFSLSITSRKKTVSRFLFGISRPI